MKKSSRENLEYALVRVLTGGIGVLPRPAAIALGRGLGRLAYCAAGRLRFMGERNLRIAFPKLRRSQRRRILRGCFDNLGRQLGEFCLSQRATVEDLRKIVEYDPKSFAHFNEARNQGRGIIMVTAHLGGWEMFALASSAFGYPSNILARPIQNPKIDRWVQSARSRFGNEIISKQNAGLTCMRILKKGGILGILADLNALPEEGVFVPFFVELACSTLAVAALALPTNAIVFPVFAPWIRARRKYVIHGGPAIEMVRTGDHERDLAVNTARVTSVIEREVRAYPDQWMWIHDRWHTLYRVGDRVCADYPLVLNTPDTRP
jgi:Kdo2-lipid IVA lauroyltransferase/acyltransferase